MRQYEPLWNKLKAEGKLELEVPLDRQAVLIRMLRKEKNLDTTFKFMCLESSIKYRVKCQRSEKYPTRLIFLLVKSIGLSTI